MINLLYMSTLPFIACRRVNRTRIYCTTSLFLIDRLLNSKSSLNFRDCERNFRGFTKFSFRSTFFSIQTIRFPIFFSANVEVLMNK